MFNYKISVCYKTWSQLWNLQVIFPSGSDLTHCSWSEHSEILKESFMSKVRERFAWPFPTEVNRWVFLFFPSEFPRWENDRARRLISVNAQFLWWRWRWRGEISVMVARLGSSLENSSPDFPPWRQSWVTGQLGPLVILVLSWSSQPAQPGPGQDTSVRQSGPWQSSTQPHLTSPVTHSNTPTLHTETDQLLRGNLVDWEFTYPFTLTWYFWSLISGH